MGTDKILVTPRGREIFLERQAKLEKKLKEIVSQKGDAYENGGNGWHDNFAFEELTRQEAMLRSQLHEMSDLLTVATVISEMPAQNSTLSIGHIAVFEDGDGNVNTYEIVGYGEGGAASRPPKIEYRAPVIAPFLGMAVGKTAKLTLAGKLKQLTLIEIKNI